MEGGSKEPGRRRTVLRRVAGLGKGAIVGEAIGGTSKTSHVGTTGTRWRRRPSVPDLPTVPGMAAGVKIKANRLYGCVRSVLGGPALQLRLELAHAAEVFGVRGGFGAEALVGFDGGGEVALAFGGDPQAIER